MTAKMKRMMVFLTSIMLILPCMALAAGGGKEAPMIIVSDTRKLTGVFAWWSNLYNDSMVWFTVLTVILIPVIGVIFGTVADFIMHHIGIDLKSRELAEH